MVQVTENITAQVWQKMNPEGGTLADLMTEEIEPLRFVAMG